MTTTSVLEQPVTAMPDTTAAPIRQALTATVAVGDLREALTWASYAIARRPAMAVLSGVLIAARRGSLTLTGYDYEVLASQTIPAPNATGKALVPAAAFRQMLAALPKGSNVHLSVEGDVLILNGGDVGGEITYRLPLLALEDYPDLPDPGQVVIPSMTGPELAHLGRVCVAAGRDDTLPVLTGVHLSAREGGGVQAATTDRYRLAVSEGPLISWPPTATALVPAATFAKASTAFRKAKGVTVSRGLDPTGRYGRLTFESAGRLLSTRLLDGEFPRYRSLLPPASETALTVDKDCLLTATRAAAAAATHHSPVTLHAAPTASHVTGGSDRDSTCTSSSALIHGAEVEGLTEPFTVGLNPKFLTDGVTALGDGRIRIALREPTKPVVITAADDDLFLYLLMPVRLVG